MKIQKAIKALEKHGYEEIRIHKAILREAKGDIGHLVKKHLTDSMAIHKVFWKDLKKSLRSK